MVGSVRQWDWRRIGLMAGAVLVALVVLVALFWRTALKQIGVNFVSGEPGTVDVRLPAGFESTIFARGLEGPRFMAYGPGGTLFVAERGANRVVALPDRNADGRADETAVVVDGLEAPSSLAFHDGWLYVGETTQISRHRVGDDLRGRGGEIVVPDLPAGGNHTTRTVIFGPDDRMFVSVGSSCNVCQEEDERRAAISVYNADGSGGRLFATGLRNAVGLAIRPGTGELWATNNGRDFMGDDLPPETVYVVHDGADYGWPRCHAGDLPDPDFGGPNACQGVEAPVVEMQAHMAPLGLTFYAGDQFPSAYRGDLFIALHGSWNRSIPVGYKVMRVPMEDGRPSGSAQDFAAGWLRDDGTAPGRPVDVVVAPDGALLISDDRGGFIYRITYTGR